MRTTLSTALLAGSMLVSVAETFHPISSITSSTAAGDLYQVSNLIQGPGSGFSENEPHNRIGEGSSHTWVTEAPNGGADYYANAEPDPVLFIDLGADRSLSEISTWGYSNTNTNGGKEFTLRFATNADGADGLGTTITYAPSFEAAFSATTRDSHSFGQTVTARYVEVTFTDNWRGLQGELTGGDRVGLGEIAFGDTIPDSGVRINEFMANNSETLEDGDGNSSDWIELYNAGPGPVELGGWHLTDSASSLKKWEFPVGTSLAEDAFLIVFASGQNTDDYLDGAGFLHTNFKLATGGEYLALVMPDGRTVKSEFAPQYPTQFSDVSYGTYSGNGKSLNLIAESDAEVLIPDNGTLGLTWTSPTFSPDDSWLSPQLGTGVGFDTSTGYQSFIDIDLLDAMYRNHSSAYIRIPFTLDDASSLFALALSIRYDDGFYAYLNGNEITSRNAPANPTWNSTAPSNIDEDNNLESIDISAFTSSLQNGQNVLAIHGINRSSTSGDFLCDAELTGSFTTSGPLLPGYLHTATPGAANTSGASNPGPEIASVSHLPAQPAGDEDLVVTASVLPRLVGIGGVELTYRVQFGTPVSLTMTDDGTGDDATAGDAIYTATIPASAYDDEDMVRWFVSAEDTASNPSRVPAFLDETGTNQSAEFFGTVTTDPGLSSDLPILQWFTQNERASHTRTGARASVYFLGRFYDNIYVRQRGGATNGSTSQKFDFNKGDSLYVNEEMSSVGEINMNANGADSTYIRQQMGFDTHRLAGNEACLSYLWQMRVNGRSDRVGVAIEQVDGDFMERYGYDPDGDLYKFVQRNNLNPVFFDTITGIEKKTGDLSNIDSVVDLVAGLNLATSAARRQWVIDNLDLPQIVNYLASRSVIQDADDLRKNFYMYFDARGDHRWRMLPWDKDYTFGVRGDGGTHLPHPFFGDEEHKKQNANQWNILYDVIFEEPVTQRIYLRRLRTLMDEVLEPASTPVNDRILENLALDIIGPASPPLSSNINSVNNYLNSRRNVLFNNYPSLIPPSQPSAPDIVIAAVEANPDGGNQEQEFIRLHNNENTEIDLSGWTIEGGVDFTFRAGTVIERDGDLYLSPSSRDFLSRTVSPKGGEELLVAAPYSGHLSNFTELLTLKDRSGTEVDSFNTPNNPGEAQQYLVISELMYHPSDPNGDAEYIELMNISDTVTLDLTGVHFTAGIEFTFDTLSLLPGERILVVLNQSAFEAVHGSGHPIAGVFQSSSRLNNGSDRIKLEDADNSTILEFTYDDESPWPAGADGGGFSLVLKNPGTFPDHDLASTWRESALVGGAPGDPDSMPFTGDPGDDLDSDGISALLEYAFGTSPDLANPSPFRIGSKGTTVQISATLNQTADDLAIFIQKSSDMVAWSDASSDFPELSHVNNGDGTAEIVFESDPGYPATHPGFFFRLNVILLP